MTDRFISPHRRGFLALAGSGLAAGLTAGGAARAGATRQTAANAQGPYDYSDPIDNMHALVKLMGDTSGRATFFHARGRVFGMMPEEHARPLLSYQGCAARKFVWDEEAGDYLFSLREWLLFTDLETGEVIDEWENPYTRETVSLPHFKGGGGAAAHRWAVEGQLRVGREELWADYGPQVYDWLFDGDDVVATIDQYVAFPSFYPPARFPRASTGAIRWELQVRTFHTRRSQLEDPSLTATEGQETWTMKNSWMGFMNMGRWPGHHLWRAAGRKHLSLDTLPADFVARSEARWPGLIEEFDAWARGDA